MSKKKKENQEIDLRSLREPWIKKNKGMWVIAVASLVLGVFVGANLIMGEGTVGQGILWGFIFAASVWAVFFFMNWFHSLFNSKK